jgi:hypothetical protein
MAKAIVVYKEKSSLIAKYGHPRSDDYLDYRTEITIKDSGKTPIELKIKFDGIYPGYAPMPPEEHTFRVASIMDLNSKVLRWFKKYDYVLM